MPRPTRAVEEISFVSLKPPGHGFADRGFTSPPRPDRGRPGASLLQSVPAEGAARIKTAPFVPCHPRAYSLPQEFLLLSSLVQVTCSGRAWQQGFKRRALDLGRRGKAVKSLWETHLQPGTAAYPLGDKQVALLDASSLASPSSSLWVQRCPMARSPKNPAWAAVRLEGDASFGSQGPTVQH